MSDQDLNRNAPAQVDEKRLKNFVYAVYALYALELFVGFTVVIGLVIAYIKRKEAYGTVYYDHLCFLIKTFWISFIFYIIWFAIMSFFILGTIQISFFPFLNGGFGNLNALLSNFDFRFFSIAWFVVFIISVIPFAIWIWYIIRVVIGFIMLLDNKPVSPTGWWL